MRRQHLSVSLSPGPTRINIRRRLWTASERGQNLPSTSNWNVPTEILSGYQPRVYVPSLAYRSDVASEGNTVALSICPRAGEAVKNLETQWYRCVSRWPDAPSSAISVHSALIMVNYVSVHPNVGLDSTFKLKSLMNGQFIDLLKSRIFPFFHCYRNSVIYQWALVVDAFTCPCFLKLLLLHVYVNKYEPLWMKATAKLT